MRVASCLATIIVLLLAGDQVLAEVSPMVPVPVAVQTGPPDWGTSNETTVSVCSYGFAASSSSNTYGTDANGYFYQTAGGTHCFFAPLDLPNGAQLTAIILDGYDTDAATDISWGVFRMTPDHNADWDIAAYYVAWNSGYLTASAPPSSTTTIDHANYYALGACFGVASQAQKVRGMRASYTLQVSPAPAVASFTDVPTSHPLFQYVEALKASGITAGCTATTYCPDSALTRGQMAVYLSKALGLHWAQ